MGDLVFVGSCNGLVHALDLKSGTLRWETKVSPDSSQYFFHGDPFVARDVVVVGADAAAGASLHAFDAPTGKERWKYPVGPGVSGPIAGAGRRVYAASLEGQVLAFDVVSGERLWSVPIKLPGFEGPAVAANRVVAGAIDGALYGLNAETGREEWRVSLGVPVTTSVTPSGTDVYVGTADGSMHRVDAGRGTVLGSQKLDAVLRPRSVPVRTGDSLLVLLTDASADYRALASVDLSLERIRWRATPTQSWSTSRVFVWGDVVVLGTSAGDVTAYCADTGAKGWSRAVMGSVRAIGGADDTLLIGTRSGGLYAIRAPRSCSGK